ncbi:MAG: bifunctional folylpolyglutamate synthase/dihydrofolate synthase [Acidobacteria bacterium]|nr:bifunctional folylpolyglutamate synthase/dihydrofolate synthase [Acidobacteriota bacterium]
MTYPDSVRFLYSLGNEIKTAKFDLARITRLLEALGSPHQAGRFVHVAGTNGKGSTCVMIESGLRAAGLRTGLYTSPHLLEPVERICIAGQPVTPAQFSTAFDRVHGAAEQLLAAGVLDLHLTYFETVTAMAFWLFRDMEVEFAVLEVGLGGRLDATNVVLPRVAVITRVDFDHEAFLGKSLEEIALEKAGILKTGVPAVFAPQRPEVEEVLGGRAAALGSRVTRAAEFPVTGLSVDRWGSRFTAAGLNLECPLAGEHQVENALTAALALQILDIPGPAIEEGIRRARWPGRLQRVSERPEIILDGAHNPSGARALARYIERFYADRKVTLIFGAMRDEAVAELSAILFPLAGEVVATAPRQPRAVRPETICRLADHPRLRFAASLPDALAILDNPDVVFITGSLFLVAEAIEALSPSPVAPGP